MAPSVLSRLLLFFSSYSPLFVILGLLNSFGNQIVSQSLYVMSFLSIVFLLFFLWYGKHLTPHNVTFTHVSPRDADTMSYIVTYLVPFVDISYTAVSKSIALGILLVVVAILYVSANLIYINPILNLLGYHIFEVESEGGKVSALICRHSYLRTPASINVISLGNYTMLEK